MMYIQGAEKLLLRIPEAIQYMTTLRNSYRSKNKYIYEKLKAN